MTHLEPSFTPIEIRPRQAGGKATRLRREDYETLIDRETWAFIAETGRWYPPEAMSLPIGEQRSIYDRMCRAFHGGRPSGVRVSELLIGGPGGRLPMRRYQADAIVPRAVILYFHGGGFILGGLDSHDDICAELCAGTGYQVLSVDYRLAPEHMHPAAFDDSCAAFNWAAAASDLPIVLCGESAGGNLAAAIAHATRRHRRAAVGQVLIYPSLGGDMTGRSYVEHAEAPMLSARDVLFYRDVRFADGCFKPDPTTAPLCDTDFADLPATVILTAQCDPLSSDGEVYRDRIAAAGGLAWWHEEAGLVHSFLRARRKSGRAREAFARLVAAVTALGMREWPYRT